MWPFCSPFWVSFQPLALSFEPRAELVCALLWFFATTAIPQPRMCRKSFI